MIDIRKHPFDNSTIDGLADTYVLVVSSDGKIVMCPRAPARVGSNPWDWCVPEDQARVKDHFINACMFRKEGIRFQARAPFEDLVLTLSFRLFPLETGQVLAMFTRVFEGELSQQERNVLALLAGGAKAPAIAAALNITASTARDHIANIKKKLSIRHPEGLRLAAHYFGLIGDRTEPHPLK